MTVAQLGGFRRAAGHLGVEQSAVSRRIRALEEGLGVSLFERGARGVTLTNAGADFVTVVESALALLAVAVTDARAAGSGQRGRLRIGLTGSSLGGVLLKIMERFCGAHPRVRIEMSDGPAHEQLAAVADRRIDLAVLPGGTTVTGLDVSELWREPLHIAIPTSHRLSTAEVVGLDEVSREHVLVSSRDLGGRETVSLAQSAGAALDIESIDVAVPLLIGLTKLNLGLAVISAGAAAAIRPPEDVVVRLLESRELSAPFAAAWSAANDNPALRRFVSTARAMRAKG
jgi:DNA-binding transcriptional LysR family regulator